MPEARDIEVVVLDVLGTMVDEAGGLGAAIGEAVAESGDASSEASVEHLLAVWHEHVEREQRRIGEGDRSYANSEVIDGEAAERVAERAGLTDPVVIGRLAAASQRLGPWEDSVAGLARLSRRFPVLGLSNATPGALLRLNAHAGLRWHQVLSADDARAYKPAPEVYKLAVEAAGCPPERVLMVAAHAWDLRGAQALGMRTAYVRRPVGDPPRTTDSFDWWAQSLDELVAALTEA
ncbi:haloacid dehalogenase type II [Streptomyces durmitorensis]|uniref:Haloacid dehalogenase type II n=1 Tax=Streptomyces durmitorensis TaxID=319947 RepID=A0ABY4Q5R0_9ACTN|nr:haloacid dehalogenase type II [Streptomyces durmitorensis]UQT61040.1 haloacid dehalogenase type II [Streptomyces durmitorensis]